MSFFIWVMLKLIVDFDTMLIGAESEVPGAEINRQYTELLFIATKSI
jgi:hypothetical protein